MKKTKNMRNTEIYDDLAKKLSGAKKWAKAGHDQWTILGCLLSLISLVIDLINSVNPYGDIKNHLDTIQQLRDGSKQYLDNPVKIAQHFTPELRQNTGLDTIYQIKQGNLIKAM